MLGKCCVKLCGYTWKTFLEELATFTWKVLLFKLGKCVFGNSHLPVLSSHSFTFMKTCVHTHLRVITFFWEIFIVIRAYKKQDKEKMMTLCFNFLKDVTVLSEQAELESWSQWEEKLQVRILTDQLERCPHKAGSISCWVPIWVGRVPLQCLITSHSSYSTHHYSLSLEAATETKGMLTTKSVCMCTRAHTSTLLLLTMRGC